MTEHHEATVQLSGAGNEAPAPEEGPVVHLDEEFMTGLGKAMQSCMEELDAIREKAGIDADRFPGVLDQLTTSFGYTYMAWRDYKRDPEAYLKQQQEALDQLSDENGVIELKGGEHIGSRADTE